MSTTIMGNLFAIGLFLGILILLEAGRRLGRKSIERDPDGAKAGTAAVEGAVFALVGLLIAFTFSGAANRFDTRRDLIIQETNVIGTAYLRLDLLPAPARQELQELFKRYLDSRLSAYGKLPNIDAAVRELAESQRLQTEIWRRSIAAGQLPDASPDAIKLLLPALNEMIDITTTRTLATQIHPPSVIYGLLVVLSLAGALLAGYSMAGSRSRSWLHIGVFGIVIGMAVYVINDLEYPRLGLIKVNAFDKALIDLRASMD